MMGSAVSHRRILRTLADDAPGDDHDAVDYMVGAVRYPPPRPPYASSAPPETSPVAPSSDLSSDMVLLSPIYRCPSMRSCVSVAALAVSIVVIANYFF